MIEKVHGPISVPSIVLLLEQIDSHLKTIPSQNGNSDTNEKHLLLFKSIPDLLSESKQKLESLCEAPLEVFVMFHFLSAKFAERKRDLPLAFTHARCANSLLER